MQYSERSIEEFLRKQLGDLLEGRQCICQWVEKEPFPFPAMCLPLPVSPTPLLSVPAGWPVLSMRQN